MNQHCPVTTAVRSSRRVSDDRKIDVVVRELNRFQIEVAGLQETKWFGSEAYAVANSVVLSSGRPVPVESFQRGEGVALVLCGRGKAAFEFGGCQWNAVSSRILVCKLKFADAWVSVALCYAPTFQSSGLKKDNFNDL